MSNVVRIKNDVPTLDVALVTPMIEEAWRRRYPQLGLKHGTKTYIKQEVEFFMGATAVLQSLFPNVENPDALSRSVPAHWVMFPMCGRPIVEAA